MQSSKLDMRNGFYNRILCEYRMCIRILV